MTMVSNGPVSKPAFLASCRVTVNNAGGSKFIWSSKGGEVVVAWPAAENPVFDSILPSGMPNAETLDRTLDTARPAVNGLLSETVTSAMLSVRPVVGSTEKADQRN